MEVKYKVLSSPLCVFRSCRPTPRIMGYNFPNLFIEDKKELFKKIYRVFEKDGFVPFLPDVAMYCDSDLYERMAFHYFHEFICEYNDERFEEEIEIFKMNYNTNAEELFRELRKCIREKEFPSTSDEVIEHILSWIPTFFQVKLQATDTWSEPLLPLNKRSIVKSCQGPKGDFEAHYSSDQIIVVNDQFLKSLNFKKFIIALCQIIDANYWEINLYEPLGIIVRNHEAYLFHGGSHLKIVGKLDLKDSRNIIFLCMILLKLCNNSENDHILNRAYHYLLLEQKKNLEESSKN